MLHGMSLIPVLWVLFSATTDALAPYPSVKNANRYLESSTENPVEVPLRIGSFNVQTLGKRKFSDDFVLNTVAMIIQRYDLILIQEVMTKEERYIENKLLRLVNGLSSEGVTYNITVNRDSPVNEYCIFFYKIGKLKLLQTSSYSNDTSFYRHPYMVTFQATGLRDVEKFVIVGHHVKPAQATEELNAMANIYDIIKEKQGIEDVLFMGDFNADCAHVTENDWGSIALWTREEFTWLIGQGMDTTTNYRKCALDRFVYTGENLNAGIISSSAKPYDYRHEFGISMDFARKISDHWPIEMRIRGKMSKKAEKKLSSEICFTVQDSRVVNVSKNALFNAAEHFLPKRIPGGFSLRNETTRPEVIIHVLQLLSSALPDIVTVEQVEAIAYKLNEGALHDVSAFADEADDFYSVDLHLTNKNSKAIVCKRTSIN